LSDPLTYEDLLRIVELVKSSEQFYEFRLKVGDIEVELRRRALGSTRMHAASPSDVTVAPPPAAPVVVNATSGAAPSVSASREAASAPRAAGSAAPSAADASDWPPDAIVVRAPMIGTFYRSPEPGARPFVLVGDHVSADTTVCIIEVMKLMNSIPAGAEGVVSHVLVEDAAPVDANTPLIVLAPDRTE
jgi:acetyl-CoA carboxylase biotin carboxyl carrier protein